jgi:hypothetical protein
MAIMQFHKGMSSTKIKKFRPCRTKFSRPGDIEHGLCAPLLLLLVVVVTQGNSPHRDGDLNILNYTRRNFMND